MSRCSITPPNVHPPTTQPGPSHTQTHHSIPAAPIPVPTPTPFPVELMSVTASPAPRRSITPFLKPNHIPFNTPIQSPGTTEHTQTKRKCEELTKHKEPKRPKNKKKAQKPQHSNQSSSKQAEPEPKSHLNRHSITFFMFTFRINMVFT